MVNINAPIDGGRVFIDVNPQGFLTKWSWGYCTVWTVACAGWAVHTRLYSQRLLITVCVP